MQSKILPLHHLYLSRKGNAEVGLHLVSENDCIVFYVASCYEKERNILWVM
jgi:hypothetical protein